MVNLVKVRSKKVLSETDLNVIEILTKVNLSMKVYYMGVSQMPDSKQDMDKFSVVFSDSDDNRTEVFDFYTGLGHRNTKSFVPFVYKPTEADVLYCLISDKEAGDMSFSEFCSNFGYDYDSIKYMHLHRK